jgi:branched-chain amino acid transport system permease protein
MTDQTYVRANLLSLAGDRDALGLVILAVAGVAAPLVLGSYSLRMATTLCMLMALAQAWNLVGGYAGLLSIAAPAFFGTGAVASGVLLLNGMPMPVAVVGSLALSLLVALVLGLPTLRLQGHYFVVATLLVAEALRLFVLNLDAFGFQGGIAMNLVDAVGLGDVSAATYNGIFYYVMLALAQLATVSIYALERSRWGLALRAVRDGEKAAAALGVPATRLKVAVFLVSAALTSIVGTTWACALGTVEANDAYGTGLTFEIIVMVFLGGRGTLWGPLIGVVVVHLLNQSIGVELGEVTQIVSGLIVVVIVLLQPDGLIQLVKRGPAAFAPQALYKNLTRYRVR